jgi:hypothetical protein
MTHPISAKLAPRSRAIVGSTIPPTLVSSTVIAQPRRGCEQDQPRIERASSDRQVDCYWPSAAAPAFREARRAFEPTLSR